MTHPPSSDFYLAIAGLIPLLLVTLALDGRRLAGSDDEEPLSMLVLFYAVIGEIAALVGLAGAHAWFWAAAASFGAALLATALVGPVALRLLPDKERVGWHRWPYIVIGLATMLAPLVAAVVYTVRLDG